jgi:hypothetical protein
MKCRSLVIISNTSIMALMSADWLFIAGLQIEGVLAYFTQIKCQKHIGDDLGDLKYVFTKKKRSFLWKWPYWYILSNLLCKNMTPTALKCILLPYKYLKFVKKCLCRSPKSMKGSQIHLALAHWKWHTPRLKNYLKPCIGTVAFILCL